MNNPEDKITVEEFTLRAIQMLSKPNSNVIHTVYSGFNIGFRKYFPGLDPVKEIDELVRAGKIDRRFAKGGAVIGRPGSIKQNITADDVLKKIGVK